MHTISLALGWRVIIVSRKRVHARVLVMDPPVRLHSDVSVLNVHSCSPRVTSYSSILKLPRKYNKSLKIVVLASIGQV